MKSVEYLVTGGAGFIGSNIAESLVAAGRSVRVFDNFLTGKRENLRSFEKEAEIVEGDLRNPDQVRRVVTGARYVLHVAALPSVPRSVAEPQLAHDVNVNGTLNVLLAARDAKCDRVVFSSSSSVYGDSEKLPKTESMTPAPLSPYAIHKLTGEHYCRVFWSLYGLPTVSLRYFNVFGPRQDPQSEYAAVIPRFITSVLAGRAPTMYGDGKQTRDFSYIENIVSANLAACTAPQKAFGGVFNIAGGGRISLLELLQAINHAAGRQVKPQFQASRPGDILHSQADIRQAREYLGWKPTVDFQEGIARTIAYYRA